MPEVTLLPCPACGASDVVMRVDTRAYVFCTACGMCGPCAPKVNAEYAIRQWNELPRQSIPRPFEEWHEDYGDVLWWRFPLEGPPYIGSPLDEDWVDDRIPHSLDAPSHTSRAEIGVLYG